MKGFYSQHPGCDVPGTVPHRGHTTEQELPPHATPARPPRHRARLAVYDSLAAAPRTVDVVSDSEIGLIEEISSKTYSFASEAGGRIPYTVIREVVENLIHADFREPVVSILDRGNTVRIADQGPGIPDKDRARMPGFSTATESMKRAIRGVGSGLPIIREYLAHSGGGLGIDDNLGRGTVVTIRAGSADPDHRDPDSPATPTMLPPSEKAVPAAPHPPLSTRQKQVLSLVLELGEAGPTAISNELSVALSTAHRDLAYLEHNGLIEASSSGRRVLTPEGASYLDSLFSQ